MKFKIKRIVKKTGNSGHANIPLMFLGKEIEIIIDCDDEDIIKHFKGEAC